MKQGDAIIMYGGVHITTIDINKQRQKQLGLGANRAVQKEGSWIGSGTGSVQPNRSSKSYITLAALLLLPSSLPSFIFKSAFPDKHTNRTDLRLKHEQYKDKELYLISNRICFYRSLWVVALLRFRLFPVLFSFSSVQTWICKIRCYCWRLRWRRSNSFPSHSHC